MEFLNYILDKVEPIKNAADLLILILMGFCSVHSVKDSREKAAKKVAAIVAVGLIGIFVVNYVFNNVKKTEDVTASSNLTADGKSGSPDSEYGQRNVRERHIQKDMDFFAAQERSRLCSRKRCPVWLYSEPRDKA